VRADLVVQHHTRSVQDPQGGQLSLPKVQWMTVDLRVLHLQVWQRLEHPLGLEGKGAE